MRICRTCGNSYHKSHGAEPFFCSQACKEERTNRCINCNEQSEDRFCSGECMAEHFGTRQCETCQRPVPQPASPPFNTMPRFCSEACRQERIEQKGHANVAVLRQRVAVEHLKERMELSQLNKRLPTKNGDPLLPYHIRAKHAPPVDHLHPNIQHSISWWNEILPEIPTAAAIETGKTGWAISEPAPCLTLVECWPWITDDTRAQIDTPAILNHWAAMRTARTATWGEIKREREHFMRRLDAWRGGAKILDRDRARMAKFMKLVQPPLMKFYFSPEQEDEYYDWLFNSYPALNTRRLTAYQWEPLVWRDRLMEELTTIYERQTRP